MSIHPLHPRDPGRPVLVAVSDAAEVAETVAVACDVCEGLGAGAVLVDIRPSEDGLVREVRVFGEPVEALLRDRDCRYLRVLAARFVEAGISVGLVVREGDFLSGLLDEVGRTRAQLVVLAARSSDDGTAGSTHLEAVVEAAPVPVMVVGSARGASTDD